MTMYPKPVRFMTVLVSIFLLSTAVFLAMSPAVSGAQPMTRIFRAFTISSTSMLPTLSEGDYILSSTLGDGTGQYFFPGEIDSLNHGRPALPERGDIVVFRYPPDPKIDYLKRVIGLPGDRIQMKKEILYLNGSAVPRTKLMERPADAHNLTSSIEYEETLPGGRSYSIIETVDDSLLDNTKEFVVPAGQYFMMGDNRDNSADSRWSEMGFVPEKNIYAKVPTVAFNSKYEFGMKSIR